MFFKRVYQIALLASLCNGCVAPIDDEIEPVDSESMPIIDGSPATTWMQQRAVSLGNCTGVIISNNHILTAAHCKPAVGVTQVRFYNGSTTPGASFIGITKVSLRPGVNPSTNDLIDSNDDFADMAVLTLAASIPLTSVPARFALDYPGEDGWGIQVGRGQHDDVSNPSSVLRYASNGLYSDNVNGGYFYTNDDRINPGDSGGPIFTDGDLQGVLWGYWFVAFATRNKYTSTRYHLSWILDSIGYKGNYSKILPATSVMGTTLSARLTGDHDICKLACEQDSQCVAYRYQVSWPNVCTLLSSISGTTGQFGSVSGIR